MKNHFKLIRSAESGSVERVKVPATNGADVNAKDSFGAAEVIRLLLFGHLSQAKWAEPRQSATSEDWLPKRPTAREPRFMS